MSKVGKKPIPVTKGVEISCQENSVFVKGPKGELSLVTRPELQVSVKEEGQEKQIQVDRKNDSKLAKSLHGLTRTLIANMIIGVVQGFSKKLKVVGTGYRANLEGKDLVLSVGFSHPVKVRPCKGIEFALKGSNLVTVSGIDKQLVGQVAAQIRHIRPPDPYKGKGIRYQDEIVRKKPGKAAKIGVA